MPLPPPLGNGELVAWRLDQANHARDWASGEGAYRVGGRWNSRGLRAVYCSLDPACAILEVAVHKGFAALDAVPHRLTALTIVEPAHVHVVAPDTMPDRAWLRPGLPSAEQQVFGDARLAAHAFILIPSVVSRQSWNLIFIAANAEGLYAPRSQEAFALDPRLHARIPETQS